MSEETGEKKPLISYPTDYTFKVMGRQEDDFSGYIRALFARLLGQQLPLDSTTEQPSSGGKYLSISVSVYLVSEEQRRTIYLQLHEERRVLYYL